MEWLKTNETRNGGRDNLLLFYGLTRDIVLGNRTVSFISCRFAIHLTKRSIPIPNPACGTWLRTFLDPITNRRPSDLNLFLYSFGDRSNVILSFSSTANLSKTTRCKHICTQSYPFFSCIP